VTLRSTLLATTLQALFRGESPPFEAMVRYAHRRPLCEDWHAEQDATVLYALAPPVDRARMWLLYATLYRLVARLADASVDEAAVRVLVAPHRDDDALTAAHRRLQARATARDYSHIEHHAHLVGSYAIDARGRDALTVWPLQLAQFVSLGLGRQDELLRCVRRVLRCPSVAEFHARLAPGVITPPAW